MFSVLRAQIPLTILNKCLTQLPEPRIVVGSLRCRIGGVLRRSPGWLRLGGRAAAPSGSEATWGASYKWFLSSMGFQVEVLDKGCGAPW